MALNSKSPNPKHEPTNKTINSQVLILFMLIQSASWVYCQHCWGSHRACHVHNLGFCFFGVSLQTFSFIYVFSA